MAGEKAFFFLVRGHNTQSHAQAECLVLKVPLTSDVDTVKYSKVFWWLKTQTIFSEFILTMDWWFLRWLSTFSHISNILAFMESVRKSFGILVYELSSRRLWNSVPIVLGPTFSSADIILSNAIGIFTILILRAIMKLIIN